MSSHYRRIVLAIVLAAGFWPGLARAGVVCDRFDIRSELDGNALQLSVDTDLPDTAVLIVTVKRSYYERGVDPAYSVDYFREKATVGEWREPHRIPLDNDKWRAELKAKQVEMAGLGLGFEVARISSSVEARMVVPLGQPDPRFGKGNVNLIGKAVRTKGARVVEDELESEYPLEPPPSASAEQVDVVERRVARRQPRRVLDTLYFKNGRSVKGTIVYESDDVVTLKRELGLDFVESTYEKSLIHEIQRASKANADRASWASGRDASSEPPAGTQGGQESSASASGAKRGLTDADRLVVYAAVEALHEKGTLSDDAIWRHVAQQYGFTVDQTRTAYVKVLFKRTSPEHADSIRPKILEALRPFGVTINGDIVVNGDFASISYIEQFAAWDEKDILDKTEERAPTIAQAIFGNAPELNRLRLEARFPAVDKTTETPTASKRTKLFDFTRK